MSKIDRKGVEIMDRLLIVIARLFDEAGMDEDELLEHEPMFRIVLTAHTYLREAGHEPDIEATVLIAQFAVLLGLDLDSVFGI